MGVLTLALALIAAGTVGPLALGLLGLTFAAVFHSANAVVAVAGLGMLCMVILLLAFVGQILCFFTPLSSPTKTRLGIYLVCALINIPLEGILSSICGFACLIAYLAFLYGVCADLDVPEGVARFNSAALIGLLGMLSVFATPFLMIFVGRMGFVGILASMLFGILAFARYAQTIISLALRANQLRLDISPQAETEVGFSRFEQPAAQAVPHFTLEGSEIYQVTEELPPLHAATKVGDSDKVSWLLSRAAVDSKAQNGLTALHIASISGDMAVADLLLRRGANMEEASEGGLTALYFAIQSNNVNLVGMFLSRGAKMTHRNDQGRTPLHWASAVPSPKLDGQARRKMTQVLLSKGADPAALDNDGLTAAALAEAAGLADSP